MPTKVHQGPIHLLHNQPDLIIRLVSGLPDLRLPSYDQIRLDAEDLSNISTTEFRADAVITLLGGGSPRAAVIVEVQLSKDDADKPYSWPVYISTLRARLRCPVFLVVICPSRSTAVWATQPILLGHPRLVLHPMVISPDEIPYLTDPGEAAESPELTVLSAIAHGRYRQRRGRQVLDNVAKIIVDIEREKGWVYYDIVLAALPEASRKYLENLMGTIAYQFQSEFALRHQAKGKAEGIAEGKAEGIAEGKAEGLAEGQLLGEADALITVLGARGVKLSAAQRERIMSCHSLKQLKDWMTKSLTVCDAEELFG
ncbi:MAG TPA: hypothetical protein VF062_12810 [Candidatus Limnocylindrales bacterium]